MRSFAKKYDDKISPATHFTPSSLIWLVSIYGKLNRPFVFLRNLWKSALWKQLINFFIRSNYGILFQNFSDLEKDNRMKKLCKIQAEEFKKYLLLPKVLRATGCKDDAGSKFRSYRRLSSLRGPRNVHAMYDRTAGSTFLKDHGTADRCQENTWCGYVYWSTYPSTCPSIHPSIHSFI